MELGTPIRVINAELAFKEMDVDVKNGQHGVVIKDKMTPDDDLPYVRMDDGMVWWIPRKAIKRVHRARVEV